MNKNMINNKKLNTEGKVSRIIAVMLVAVFAITALIGVNTSSKAGTLDEASSEDNAAEILKLNDNPVFKERGITLTGKVIHGEYGDVYVCEKYDGKTAKEWVDDNITIDINKSWKDNKVYFNYSTDYRLLGNYSYNYLFSTLNYSKQAEFDITFTPGTIYNGTDVYINNQQIENFSFDPSTKITKHYEINLTDNEYEEFLDKYEYSHALKLLYNIWWYNKFNSENLDDEYYTLINNKEAVQKAVEVVERRHDPSKKETDLGRISNKDFKNYLYAIDKFGVKYDKSKWVKTAPKVKTFKVGFNANLGEICDSTVLKPPYKGALWFHSYDTNSGPSYISGMAVKYSKNKNLKKSKIKYMKKDTFDYRKTYYSSTMYYKIGYYRKINGKRIVNWSQKTYKTKWAK